MGEKLDLFDHPRYACDLEQFVADVLAEALDRSGLDKDEFARQVAALARVDIQPGHLQAWLRGEAVPPGRVFAAALQLVGYTTIRDRLSPLSRPSSSFASTIRSSSFVTTAPFDPVEIPCQLSDSGILGRVTLTDLLAGIASSFSAQHLSGTWATAYAFSRGKYHADIAHLIAISDRLVRIQNYPPEPRTQGHAKPYRNQIQAELIDRHLIGVWKNESDMCYFGALHLAVLPGETVMHGYYTGFTTDVAVDCGPWRWVLLDPESVANADLSHRKLRNPEEIYQVLIGHTQYDAPLTVHEVLED